MKITDGYWSTTQYKERLTLHGHLAVLEEPHAKTVKKKADETIIQVFFDIILTYMIVVFLQA